MLSRLADEGLLKIDHPLSAAEQLNWLIAAEPLNRAMLLGDNQPFTPAELTAHADAAVGTFLGRLPQLSRKPVPATATATAHPQPIRHERRRVGTLRAWR